MHAKVHFFKSTMALFPIRLHSWNWWNMKHCLMGAIL